MIIHSMTATFGKLEHETLTFQPGLNVIQAPNEWGKSTWCAFLSAMLYGIETRAHTTKSVLADKERYAPWSGAPMAGRIDLTWQGRAITIERRSKGRSVFGVFRAYETETGLDIPELTAANCGQTLLGVEKSVFLRSSFLRLTDLPVTQDEALRRRLNAIVTTGDESGTADALAQKLRDLKNRVRLNRSTGLLPQAEARQRELRDTLTELRELKTQSARYHQRLDQLEEHKKALDNHRVALEYAAGQSYNQKLADARASLEEASRRLDKQQALCAALPAPDAVERTLDKLQQLRSTQDALHLEAQMLAPAPDAFQVHPVFQTVSPQAAEAAAREDYQAYQSNSRKEPFPWYCPVLALAGLALMATQHWIGFAAGVLAILAGVLLFTASRNRKNQKHAAVQALLRRYSPLTPEEWVNAARQYAQAATDHAAQSAKHRSDRESLNARMQQLARDIHAVTGGSTLADCQQYYTRAQEDYWALTEARREHHRAQELVSTLESSRKEVPAPAFPDTMTYTPQETARLLSDCALEQRQVQLKLGNTQGRMEALGSEAAIEKELEEITRRIAALEDTYAALELAQGTLSDASAELQRRFAPRISQRAQAIFADLTGGRYDRLTLGEDLSLQAGAENEDTLRAALWRSDGTVDQLYLALRLAMAEELTPEAPLILDDALVRFDDVRLERAMALLRREAEDRQIILFTCQSRETAL